MTTKTCTACNETKTLDQFSKDKASPDDHQYRCKACQKAKGATYHAENREQRNTKNATYSQAPKGKFTAYKSKAKTRGLPFDLTFDEFMTFWQADCSYCKRPIPTIGIDRIDSNIGYTLANAVPCCTACNTMKLDFSLEEWQTNMLMALKGMGII